MRKFNTLDDLKGYKYSPQPGNIYRSVQIGQNGKPKVITSRNPGGYIHFQHNGKMISAHRAAFKLMGIDPTGMEVDHINGIRTDNRWENLRLVSSRGNATNKSFHRDGRKVGARFCKQKNKWRSEIIINGKGKHLGFFSTEEEAHGAYINAMELAENGVEVKTKGRPERKLFCGKYRKYVNINGIKTYVGMFESIEEADKAGSEVKKRFVGA